MTNEKMKELILNRIPNALIQGDDLWRLCGSPQYSHEDKVGFSGCVLELFDEGKITDGRVQNGNDRYPLRAYRLAPAIN